MPLAAPTVPPDPYPVPSGIPDLKEEHVNPAASLRLQPNIPAGGYVGLRYDDRPAQVTMHPDSIGLEGEPFGELGQSHDEPPEGERSQEKKQDRSAMEYPPHDAQ